jgi:hypothetical protein
MDTFEYHPLDSEARSFRLIRLYGGAQEQLECELFEGLIHGENAVPFEALSYVWGSYEAAHTIRLYGKNFALTENLHVALQNLRYEKEDRVLWVDAICINQRDKREQVATKGSK